MNIVMFGPPGAGKGTQSENLVKDYNLTSSSIIWLLSQLVLIFLRLIQIIGFCNIFINNEKKYIWPIIFLSFFILPFLITAIGIGNPRYRIPIDAFVMIIAFYGLYYVYSKYFNMPPKYN